MAVVLCLATLALPSGAAAQRWTGLSPAVTVSFLPVLGGTRRVLGARLGLLTFDSGPVIYSLSTQWWGSAPTLVEEPPVLALGVTANFKPIRRDPYRASRITGRRQGLFIGVGPMVLGRKQPNGDLKLRPAGQVELGGVLRTSVCCAISLSGQGFMDWQGAVVGLSGSLWLGGVSGR